MHFLSRYKLCTDLRNHNAEYWIKELLVQMLENTNKTPEKILKQENNKTRQISDDAWPLLDIVGMHCRLFGLLFVIIVYPYIMLALQHLTFFVVVDIIVSALPHHPVVVISFIVVYILCLLNALICCAWLDVWLFQFNANQ